MLRNRTKTTKITGIDEEVILELRPITYNQLMFMLEDYVSNSNCPMRRRLRDTHVNLTEVDKLLIKLNLKKDPNDLSDPIAFARRLFGDLAV